VKRKRIIALTAALLIAYVIGYLLLRSGHFIVHSVVRGHNHTYLERSVRGGDMGIIGGLIESVAAIFYTPLRFIERGFWYLRHPVGTPLSPTHRSRLPQ